MRRLVNQVRPYDWGSTTAIPRLLGTEPDGRPQAEMWLGAHAGAPSLLAGDDGVPRPLDAAIAADPARELGSATLDRFGPRLPFLLKILAAAEPLSLQAHPDLDQASAGYAAEEAAGRAREARERNYKDPYHKPELVVALEPFDALCGFRAPAAALDSVAGLTARLAERLRDDLAGPDEPAALRAALTRLLTLAPTDRADLVGELVAEARHRVKEEPGDGDPNLRCTVELAGRYPGDPGAVAALLLNWVRLAPGEALFLPAGNVHAYLRGTGVEIMASSDNVLRAGLTSKHVDVPELLKVVRFAVLPVPYVTPLPDPVPKGGWWCYPVPVDDFALWLRDTARPGDLLPGAGPRVVLALDGTATLRAADGAELELRRGESAFVPAADPTPRVTGDARLVVAAPG